MSEYLSGLTGGRCPIHVLQGVPCPLCAKHVAPDPCPTCGSILAHLALLEADNEKLKAECDRRVNPAEHERQMKLLTYRAEQAEIALAQTREALQRAEAEKKELDEDLAVALDAIRDAP